MTINDSAQDIVTKYKEYKQGLEQANITDPKNAYAFYMIIKQAFADYRKNAEEIEIVEELDAIRNLWKTRSNNFDENKVKLNDSFVGFYEFFKRKSDIDNPKIALDSQFASYIERFIADNPQRCYAIMNNFCEYLFLVSQKDREDQDRYLKNFPPHIEDMNCLDGTLERMESLSMSLLVDDKVRAFMDSHFKVMMGFAHDFKDFVTPDIRIHVVSYLEKSLGIREDGSIYPASKIPAQQMTNFLIDYPGRLASQMQKNCLEIFDKADDFAEFFARTVGVNIDYDSFANGVEINAEQREKLMSAEALNFGHLRLLGDEDQKLKYVEFIERTRISEEDSREIPFEVARIRYDLFNRYYEQKVQKPLSHLRNQVKDYSVDQREIINIECLRNIGVFDRQSTKYLQDMLPESRWFIGNLEWLFGENKPEADDYRNLLAINILNAISDRHVPCRPTKLFIDTDLSVLNYYAFPEDVVEKVRVIKDSQISQQQEYDNFFNGFREENYNSVNLARKILFGETKSDIIEYLQSFDDDIILLQQAFNQMQGVLSSRGREQVAKTLILRDDFSEIYDVAKRGIISHGFTNNMIKHAIKNSLQDQAEYLFENIDNDFLRFVQSNFRSDDIFHHLATHPNAKILKLFDRKIEHGISNLNLKTTTIKQELLDNGTARTLRYKPVDLALKYDNPDFLEFAFNKLNRDSARFIENSEFDYNNLLFNALEHGSVRTFSTLITILGQNQFQGDDLLSYRVINRDQESYNMAEYIVDFYRPEFADKLDILIFNGKLKEKNFVYLNNFNDCPLAHAIKHGNNDVLKIFANRKLFPKGKFIENMNGVVHQVELGLFRYACQNDSVKSLEGIAALGANIDLLAQDGHNPLSYAAAVVESQDIVKKLLDLGANINSPINVDTWFKYEKTMDLVLGLSEDSIKKTIIEHKYKECDGGNFIHMQLANDKPDFNLIKRCISLYSSSEEIDIANDKGKKPLDLFVEKYFADLDSINRYKNAMQINPELRYADKIETLQSRIKKFNFKFVSDLKRDGLSLNDKLDDKLKEVVQQSLKSQDLVGDKQTKDHAPEIGQKVVPKMKLEKDIAKRPDASVGVHGKEVATKVVDNDNSKQPGPPV